MIITIFSKFSGFIREMVFSYFMGTSSVKDIYVISNNITAIAFGFVFAAVTQSIIPMYNHIQKKEGEERADLFTSNLSNILVFVATGFIILTLIFTEPIVKLFAGGFSPEQIQSTVQFTRIVVFTIYISAFSSVFLGYLNIKNDFVTPATPGIIMNIFLIFFAFLAAKMDNWYILAFGVIIANLMKYMFFPRALRRVNYKHKLYVNFKDPYLKMLLAMALPIVISVAAQDISTMVDQALATYLTDSGGVSAMDYSAKMIQLISGIILVSITTAIYPTLSRLGEAKKIRKLKATVMESITSAYIIILPAAVGISILAEPIIRLVFQRGQFDAQSTAMTANILRFYAPGLIGMVLRDISMRALYALKDMRTPVVVTVIQVVVDVSLNFLLSYFWGLTGLAVSTSIGAIVGGLLMLFVFRVKCGPLGLRQSLISIAKLFVASLIMGFSSLSIYRAFAQTSYVLGLFLAVFLGALIYAILILFLRIPEVQKLVNLAYHKVKKKKRTR